MFYRKDRDMLFVVRHKDRIEMALEIVIDQFGAYGRT